MEPTRNSNIISYNYPEITEAENKYYFIKEDSRSYTLINLALIACEHINNKIQSNKNHDLPTRRSDLKSPGGNFYGLVYFPSDSTLSVIKEKTIKAIKESAFVDWAKTTNQTTCPISLEEFEEPVILNLTGKSYSKKSIMKALEEFPLSDKELKLEDGFTITPSHMNDLKLYPNQSLTVSVPISIPINHIVKKFDQALAEKNNIKDFSSFLKTLPKDLDTGLWNYKMLYNFYAEKRSLPKFTNLNETIQNLIIEDLTIPEGHPKCNEGSITFKNVLFRNCTIIVECWCGLAIKSSKFIDCKFDLKKLSRAKPFKMCEYEYCKFIINNSSLGNFSFPIPPICPQNLQNLFEDWKDFKNCTLHSEKS